MDISERSMTRIVKERLNKKAYKQGKAQFLSDASKARRKDRSKNTEQFINKENDRLYASSKPNVTVKRSGYPKTLTVFADITADTKTSLIFVPQNIKINGINYLDMLRDKVLPWARKHFGNKQ
ncbi:hypothetical protein OESDEN_05172 [Oesophagostomum dentatum]|uniref:Uncharacterized protein n=1 Tax=Oesophagostomum dentatum TaxID=61180 RepID=A0A0B1TC77_OESDE|nr:hypothetical protein OESDEN_05172 [Oesophagostomum dentatum]